MNSTLACDTRLRTACVDMYNAFYGRQRPSCIPKPEFSVVLNLKEQKALVNAPSLPDELGNNLNIDDNNDNLITTVDQQQQIFLNKDNSLDNLDFDSAFNKRKHDESDEFDEKFNKEKRFKNSEYEHQYTGDDKSDLSPNYYSSNQASVNIGSNSTINNPMVPSTIEQDEDYSEKDDDKNEQTNINQQQAQDFNPTYYEDSNDYSNYNKTTSTYLAPQNDNNSRMSDFNSPTNIQSKLNEQFDLDDTNAQCPPELNATSSNQMQVMTSDNQQTPLTFSISKTFGLTSSSKKKDKGEHSSKDRKKKKKKKKKKEKKQR